MGVSCVERLDVEVVLRLHAVDVEDFLEPRPLLPAALLHHAVDQHAFAQAELLDHRAGHEGIGPLALIVVVGIAEEAVAVGVHFQHAAGWLQWQRLAVFDRLILWNAPDWLVTAWVTADAAGPHSAATATTASSSASPSTTVSGTIVIMTAVASISTRTTALTTSGAALSPLTHVSPKKPLAKSGAKECAEYERKPQKN